MKSDETILDATADGAFGGKTHNHRAGYSAPLYWARRMARKGGTLQAGEGLLLVAHYEGLVRDAHAEGWHGGRTSAVNASEVDAWEQSHIRASLEEA